jgi:hypothetical protein
MYERHGVGIIYAEVLIHPMTFFFSNLTLYPYKYQDTILKYAFANSFQSYVQ